MIRLSLLVLLLQAFHLQGQRMLASGAVENLHGSSVVGILVQDTPAVGICRTLLIDCWFSKAGKKRETGNFGLRFKPVDDQNIYLLYQYELKNVNAKTEIGFSVNHFNAFSVKYAQKFAFNGFN